MKRLLLCVSLALALVSCTLSPRQSRGRPLSPDREMMTPAHFPEDSALLRPDSIR
ncbi:hypothetical protein [Hymenobacter rubripertinctus]|uniref:hypothetical protein n=1 Tax=Hymenobacter rubripertinctus TaxID=2029981 RepID=UPI0015FF0189|nr:hypothetical protein [Hymenobacter rubripertinctus]